LYKNMAPADGSGGAWAVASLDAWRMKRVGTLMFERGLVAKGELWRELVLSHHNCHPCFLRSSIPAHVPEEHGNRECRDDEAEGIGVFLDEETVDTSAGTAEEHHEPNGPFQELGHVHLQIEFITSF